MFLGAACKLIFVASFFFFFYIVSLASSVGRIFFAADLQKGNFQGSWVSAGMPKMTLTGMSRVGDANVS